MIEWTNSFRNYKGRAYLKSKHLENHSLVNKFYSIEFKNTRS